MNFKTFLYKYRDIFSCLLMAVSAGFILAGYDFVRTPSDSLLKDAYGIKYFSLSLAVMPIVAFALVYIYGRLLSHFTAVQTLTITNLMSAFVILSCYLLISSGIRFGSLFLFLFREAYIVLLIEQIWSFINNTIKSKVAKRINGPLLAISTIGSLLATWVVKSFVIEYGTHNMLLLSALTFIPAVFFARLAYRISSKSEDYYKEQLSKTKKLHKNGKDSLGLSLFKKESMLVVILLVIVSSQIFSTIASLNYQTVLLEAFPNKDLQTQYSANVYMWLSGASLTLQFVVVPIVLLSIPLQYVLLFVPFINLLAMGYVILNPGLSSSAIAFMIFKSMDYSLFRAAKEILYIPLSFEAKFRAKELIDVLGYRTTKGFTALLVYFAQSMVAISTTIFGAIGAAACLSWLLFVIPVTKKRKL